MLNHSIKIGASFGLTSGIITTLGLMVGLSAGTQSQVVVLGGILTIAIADAFSDALGIHISEESEQTHTDKEIWQSTISAFLAKFFFALTFVIPVILFDLTTAIYVSIAWGLSSLCVLSFFISRNDKDGPWKAVLEHLFIAVIVIVSTYYTGQLISMMFGEM